MRLVEFHPADQPGRNCEGSRVDHEHDISPEQRGDHTTQASSQREVERPGRRTERVSENDVFRAADVWDYRSPRWLEECDHDGFQEQEWINNPNHGGRTH